jgi:hypothetical protein
MDGEWGEGKDLEDSCRYLCRDIILAFTWRGWAKPLKPVVLKYKWGIRVCRSSRIAISDVFF